MPGNGKYTTYAPVANSKNALLAKLFKDGPTANLVGKENDAREAVIAIAKQFLTAPILQGDTGFFPNGVSSNYEQSPDITTVQWNNPGDAANGYFPDLSSPGPGKTDGKDKNVDPQLATADVKPNYVVGTPDGGTQSPSTTSAKLSTATELGEVQTMGDSGANI